MNFHLSQDVCYTYFICIPPSKLQPSSAPPLPAAMEVTLSLGTSFALHSIAGAGQSVPMKGSLWAATQHAQCDMQPAIGRC